MRPAFTAFLLTSAAAACTPQPPPPPDGGLAFLPEQHTDFVFTVTTEQPDRSATPDAGTATPAPLPLLSTETVLPDGSAQPLARDGVTTVEPSARFRVEVGARLRDARLSLLDAQDAMVAADGTTEATATTRFALTPAAPLRPGSSYRLRLEGSEERLLRAEDGRSFEPVSLAVRAWGEPPAPARRAKRKRAR